MSLWRLADPSKRHKVGIEWLNEYAETYRDQFRYLRVMHLRKFGGNLTQEVREELEARKEQLKKLNTWRQHVLGHLDESVCIRDKFTDFIVKNHPFLREVEEVLNFFCEAFNALSEAYGGGGRVPPTNVRICREAESLFRSLPRAEQSPNTQM